MPTLIILKLVPSKPTLPAVFKQALEGLQITAYGLTVQDPTKGMKLGVASGVTDSQTPVSIINETDTTLDQSIQALDKSIIQDVAQLPEQITLPDTNQVKTITAPLESSVATAVIIVKPLTPHPGGPSFDVRFEFKRNDLSIPDSTIEYNIPTVAQNLVTDQSTYSGLPISAYFSLPVAVMGLSSNSPFITLDPNGNPPVFSQVLNSIDLILTQDHPTANPPQKSALEARSTPLTAPQCLQIASEIIWNRLLYPIPAPTNDIHLMYTTLVDVKGNPLPVDSSVDNTRQQLESSIQNYHLQHNAEASTLSKYIAAASAAVFCERLTNGETLTGIPPTATLAGITFPVETGQPSASYPQASVVLQNPATSPDASLNPLPLFNVPAPFFYSLGSTFPQSVSIQQRYNSAIMASEDQLTTLFQAASDSGLLGDTESAVAVNSSNGSSTTTLSINMYQAARRLTALGSPSIGSSCDISTLTNSAPTSAPNIYLDWLQYEGLTSNITSSFWGPSIQKYPKGYVTLVLQAITQGECALVAAIEAQIPVNSVQDLVKITQQQWENFFTQVPSNQNLLPTFTLPGTTLQRADAFVQRVQKYFIVQPKEISFTVAAGGHTSTFSVPSDDILKQFSSQYPGTFSFGNPLDHDAVEKTVKAILPDNFGAQSWLLNALETVVLLVQVTSSCPSNLQFSVIEALYARGFTSASAVHPLSETEFESALVGSVAYPYAKDIFTAFTSQQQHVTAPTDEPAWTFAPVNGGGTLIDCTPPYNLSPLGPISYLFDILNASIGEAKVADLLSARRASIGKMQASLLNLESRISKLDIINENLEALGSNPGQSQGIFLNSNPETESSDGDQPSSFATIPQHSSPAISESPQVYKTLKSCFTALDLPYDRSLDVSRSLLSPLGTDRFEVMRHFHKNVTELAIDAKKEPEGFQKSLWRYPVRFDIALEYLHISSDEYSNLFSGSLGDKDFLESILQLDTALPTPPTVSFSWFLKSTGLKYDDFIELWKCKYVQFSRALSQSGTSNNIGFPSSEPYNTGELQIALNSTEHPLLSLRKLFVFIRLWKILSHVDGPAISFSELAEISTTLSLFEGSSINSDFVRQLAALIMLRDHFGITLTQPTPSISSHGQLPQTPSSISSVGVPFRTPTSPASYGQISQEISASLLSLWQGSKENPSPRNGAIALLLDHIETYSRSQFGGSHRALGFRKELEKNLNIISSLAGFSETDPWYAKPTSTLRFAEIVSKVYASRFTLGEISLLFTTDEHIRWDDPFTLPNILEAAVDPLKYPDDEFSLWKLRKRLMHVEVSDDAVLEWSWKKIASSLHDLGYVPSTENDPLTSLGERFFAQALEDCGQRVNHDSSIFKIDLSASATTPSLWNSDPNTPFRYDAEGTGQLWFKLPLPQEAVIQKLMKSRQLSDTEIQAFQNLYFAPRAVLAPFALIFPDFERAVRELIEAPSEHQRFRYFQRHFALFHRRCEIIAGHLSDHVSEATKHDKHSTRSAAWSILRRLFADENSPVGGGWESESGASPAQYTWEPHLSGSAFAAILGLTGTGLLGEFEVDGEAGPIKVWRTVTRDLTFFGHHEDKFNTPLPTIIPNPDLKLERQHTDAVNAVNGFAVRESNEEALGGGQCFRVYWSGSLLVEDSGEYIFFAGHPRPDDEKPDFEAIRERHHWLLTLQRGDKSWTALNHHWESQPAPTSESAPLLLHRGVYHIEIYLEKTPPDFSNLHPEKTGFQVKYAGPDTKDCLSVVPASKLFRESKIGTLGEGLNLPVSAATFLNQHYTSSVRDIRRTYQRAFKGLLFTSRFDLSAELNHHDHLRESELDYFLDHPQSFLGTSYYRGSASSSTIMVNRAYFDFNLLPVMDNYDTAEKDPDQRAQPTPQRKAALFDWWERIFDYSKLRHWVQRQRSRQCWMLFNEATEQIPQPGQLLRYLVTDVSLAPLIEKYFDGHGSYSIMTADLSNEQWAIRCWFAGLWVHRLKKRVFSKYLEKAEPWLWSAEDPNLAIGAESGNQNLRSFFQETFSGLGNLDEIRSVYDSLRVRARAALLAYLCDKNRVPLPFNKGAFASSPLDLTDLLLLNVEAGVHERTTRVDDALDSIHRLVSRIRLGLEPEIQPNPEFKELWDTKFKTSKVWEAQKRRQIYQENWIQWDELHKAEKSEGFRLLTNELRRNVLTIPKPGGHMSWPAAHVPSSRITTELQNLELPSLELSPADTAIDGVNLLALPSHGARKSLLSSVPVAPSITPEVGQSQIPLWMNAAIKMGIQFVRLAAASTPPLELYSQVPNGPAERETPLTVDEFYFWITPASWFNGDAVYQNAGYGARPPAPANLWDPGFNRASTEPSLQALLTWNPESMVHLNWCRVHFGSFEPPRRSYEGFHSPGLSSTPQLTFTGRTGDSLAFSVVGGADSFRYDIPTDTAVSLLAGAINPVTDTSSFPSPLKAYPFFIYFDAGAPLIPASNFSTCLAVAGHLRSQGQFEACLKWYEMAFNPLRRDNTWETSSSSVKDIPPKKVKARAVILDYLETLLQWANSLAQESSSASNQRAALIFDMMERILGPRPKRFSIQETGSLNITLDSFVSSASAINPRLIEVYDRLADARSQLSYNSSGNPSGTEISFDKYQINHSPYKRHPYRFLSLLPRALDLAGYVRTLGGDLLQAFEKGDAEYLASLQSTHEQQITTLSLEMKKNQFRESDWDMQSLQTALSGALTRFTYYQNLIHNGPIANENGFTASTALALALKTASGVSLAVAEALTLIPDEFTGDAGIAGPLVFSRITGGSSLSSEFNTAANILSGVSEMANTTANLCFVESGWDRRLEEWNNQVDTITLEIRQLEQQKLAADRRKAISQRDLNITQRQIEHSAEVQDFMRDKTASLDLYIFLQQETAILYRQAYDLAIKASLEAQQMFYYERHDSYRDFVPLSTWSNLQEGLLAGERLELALHTMERAYMEKNYREQEVAKQISLNMQFPAAFLLLKTTGKCEIDIPEWMFDLDYPGQYMRRIRNVSLTIPCVIGPYTGIHCRLELLSSRIRVHPSLPLSTKKCSPDCTGKDCAYDIQSPSDARFVQQFGAYESIATSTGQSDTGLFEINFNDARYLPFEFSGAVSRWRIELPAQNNQFNLGTLTDVVMTLNYTSRDGGEDLRVAANEAAQRRLPGNGWSFFDVKYQFPDAWNLLHQTLRKKQKHGGKGGESVLQLQFNRNMFPFLNGQREICIVRVQVLIRAPEHAGVGEYMRVLYRHSEIHPRIGYKRDAEQHVEFDCVMQKEYPGLYRGMLDLKFNVPRMSLGYQREGQFGSFVFPKDVGSF
ncbi:uncharacterized protein K444DRAFT_664882 [Hyaloscypha bicolor E]|uniref:Uncharacterized protein n=1 Tax=Hyaloscypha bicolor E TaxID=1095630 RepID=A0A2J6T4R3_9HELO|nr:uncharacterized protein K444DRAFT_664882 [Hyaloscypha bicolor E]PMD58002.1 hypothetical protein K444DRAFT_664882 [Hyaloscypha bicolor E]